MERVPLDRLDAALGDCRRIDAAGRAAQLTERRRGLLRRFG